MINPSPHSLPHSPGTLPSSALSLLTLPSLSLSLPSLFLNPSPLLSCCPVLSFQLSCPDGGILIRTMVVSAPMKEGILNVVMGVNCKKITGQAVGVDVVCRA